MSPGPIDVTMPAAEGFGLVLVDLAATIEANWRGTAERADPECLHQLRIALRRTRVVLAHGKTVLPRGLVATARQQFAWLAGSTGPARDLDVYLMGWDGHTLPLGSEAAAALAPVREVLEARRSAAHAALAEALASDAGSALRGGWRASVAEAGTHEPRAAHAERPLGRVVAERLARAQSKLVRCGREIELDTPAERVHQLRKDTKKLRYLIECFAGILPDAPTKKVLRRLKGLQDDLGEHQDAAVHLVLMGDIADELYGRGAALDTLLAIGRLTERLEQDRVDARAGFADRFGRYDTKATRRAFAALLDEIS